MEDVEVGANLRRVRERQGFTQTQLAEAVRAAGWPAAFPQTIVKVEKGQRTLKFAEAVAIVDALEVPLDALARPADERGADVVRLVQLDRKFRQALANVRELELNAGDQVARLGEARRAWDAAVAEFVRKYPDVPEDLIGEVEPERLLDEVPLGNPEWQKHPRMLSELRAAREHLRSKSETSSRT